MKGHSRGVCFPLVSELVFNSSYMKSGDIDETFAMGTAVPVPSMSSATSKSKAILLLSTSVSAT